MTIIQAPWGLWNIWLGAALIAVCKTEREAIERRAALYREG